MSAKILLPGSDGAPIFLVIGSGLIGTETAFAVKYFADISQEINFNINWDASVEGCRKINACINEELKKGKSRVEIFWCAGKAGFSSSDEELESEYNIFKTILQQLFNSHKKKTIINLVSSAGGLYEGCEKIIQKDTKPNPVRPYGRWKLQQEQFLQDMNLNHRIFRVSTVYGLPRPGTRLGIVSALIKNTLNGIPVNIFARPDTIRDYVFVTDVARKMVLSALQNTKTGKVQVLASGRSISILYIIRKINTLLGKAPNIFFSTKSYNERNIVYSKSCLADDWCPTSFEEGISRVAMITKSGQVIEK
jgi:UDP-glucose 4-epimerase